MARSTPPFDESKRDVSESKRPDQGQQLTTYIDKVLDGIKDLGSQTSMQKTWHLTQMPELELAHLTLTFLDYETGMIDTDVLCEVSAQPFDPTSISDLCVWFDPDVGVVSSTAGVTSWQDKFALRSFLASGTGTPELVTVSGLNAIQFDGNDRMAEDDPGGDSCLSKPGAGDFTSVNVFSSTSTSRGWIWGYSTARRYFVRIANNGSDCEFNVDDDTVAQTITADDVDFANGDIYIIFATRDGDTLRFHYGTGGALLEASNSPLSLGSGYGSLTAPTNSQMGDVPAANQGIVGNLYHQLFYSKALDATERSDLYTYLVGEMNL